MSDLKITSFSNQSNPDKTATNQNLLQQFVQFHWDHYANEPRYTPLLDYEYLGSRLLGITGYFEPRNLFYQHGESQFFLAWRGDKIVGRCNAYVNHAHNQHWHDKVGFFANFEAINDPVVAQELLKAAEKWLREEKKMESIRGPQNFPINGATPGVLVEGFDSRNIIYYHFNYPYYKDLLTAAGYHRVMDVMSWEIAVQGNTVGSTLAKLSQKILERYQVKIEHWGDRPLAVRKKEMLAIYNDAWDENFGYVPFTQAEFDKEIDDMQLIMQKKLFLFAYIDGEPAAFFGGVPNIIESMKPLPAPLNGEIIRAAKMLALQSRIKGFRLGYLGVKKKFHKRGLEGVLLWKQSEIARKLGYEYCDVGWILENNTPTIRLVERCGALPSKRYSTFEKSLSSS